MVSICVKSPKVEKANTVIVAVTITGIFAKLKNLPWLPWVMQHKKDAV
jgi:hypothetical protein